MSIDRLTDKTNIRVSVEANKASELLKDTGYFEDELTIAKFALAYAIKQGLDKNLEEFKLGAESLNKWNIGSIDGDSYLRELIISLHPITDTPYRYVEALISIGLEAIGNAIKTDGFIKISNYM